MPNTPNTSRYVSAVRGRFSWYVNGGTCNCRRIAGTSSWSQHAWCNASDVMVGPWGTSSSRNKARGDALVGWLMEYINTTGGRMRRYQFYGIRTILWWGRSRLTGNRVSGHYDHVHVDFWPKGIWTPPCARGSLRVQYPSGAVRSSFPLYPNYKIITQEEKSVATYRTVRNVPEDSRGNPASWAKAVIDWGIATRLIVVDDNHPDDWKSDLNAGRYWTFEHRRRNQ